MAGLQDDDATHMVHLRRIFQFFWGALKCAFSGQGGLFRDLKVVKVPANTPFPGASRYGERFRLSTTTRQSIPRGNPQGGEVFFVIAEKNSRS